MNKIIRNGTGSKQATKRSERGQGIAEGAACMVVMVPVVGLLILLLLNTYFVATYNIKLQSIALNGARLVTSDEWWLGMTRTDYSQAAEDNARQAINGQLAILGLSCKTPPVFTYTEGVALRKKKITVVRVDFDVTPKLVRGFFFPSVLTLHASGVSSNANHAVTRHGQIFLEAIDPVTHSGIGIRIPAYNATVGMNTPANPVWLRAGRSAGKFPVAYLQVKASSEGSTLNRMEDDSDDNGKVTTESTPTMDWPNHP